MKKVDTLINALPLKDMEASLLQRAVVSFADTMPHIDTDLVREAIHIAAYLHRNDYRQGRKGKSEDHYITHPLRNTLRIIRYGCSDQDIIIASILHDTVEDHAFEIAEEFVEINVTSEQEARDAAYSYISSRFGSKVSSIVYAVSNPILVGDFSKAEKRKLYVEHVESVLDVVEVLMVKFSDFVDNAVGLYHNVNDQNAGMIKHLSSKYLPLVDIFAARIDEFADRLPVSAEGLLTMREHLQFGRSKLNELSSLA